MNARHEKQELLKALYFLYNDFQKSSLYIKGAASLVKGEGDPAASLMFIGEAPGREEDEQARPFVGRSGKLLTKVIESCGFSRSDVFITNIVKCRPPENRTPTLEEVQTGKKLLLQHEIAIIKPTLLVTLGACSLQGLLEESVTMSQVRGTMIPYQNTLIFPTYHPAYILRNPSALSIFSSDIKKAFEYVQNAKK